MAVAQKPAGSVPSSTAPVLLEQAVGASLEKIWKEPRFRRFCHRDFLAPYQLQPGSLLFVGINPSYSEADAHIRYYDPHRYQHSYFQLFNELAREAKQPWSHLDLLYHRETKQQSIDTLLKDVDGLAFIWEQLKLFPALVELAQPSVILICNAKARTFVGFDPHGGRAAWLKLKFEWDESLGTYRYQGIPVFFSSMLKGAGALDVGSRQRLFWHVK